METFLIIDGIIDRRYRASSFSRHVLVEGDRIAAVVLAQTSAAEDLVARDAERRLDAAGPQSRPASSTRTAISTGGAVSGACRYPVPHG